MIIEIKSKQLIEVNPAASEEHGKISDMWNAAQLIPADCRANLPFVHDDMKYVKREYCPCRKSVEC